MGEKVIEKTTISVVVALGTAAKETSKAGTDLRNRTLPIEKMLNGHFTQCPGTFLKVFVSDTMTLCH
jgi:hypothetical protein